MMQNLKSKTRQAGFTLIELITVIAVGAILIGGALALSSSANSAANSSQFTRDLTAIRAQTKQIYNGQGGYGTASLNDILINAKAIPSTLAVSGSTITHPMNGTVAIAGNTTNFTITMTNVPTDICTTVVSGATGYLSVQVGSNTAITAFPVSPAISSAQCAGGAQTLVFTAS